MLPYGTVLTMKDTNTYKVRLEEELAKLEAEMATIARQNAAHPQEWEAADAEDGDPDPNVQANKLETFAENASLLEDLQPRYDDVKDALGRIEAGTYGVCEVGGEEIEEDRLEADPAARTCKAHLQ